MHKNSEPPSNVFSHQVQQATLPARGFLRPHDKKESLQTEIQQVTADRHRSRLSKLVTCCFKESCFHVPSSPSPINSPSSLLQLGIAERCRKYTWKLLWLSRTYTGRETRLSVHIKTIWIHAAVDEGNLLKHDIGSSHWCDTCHKNNTAVGLIVSSNHTCMIICRCHFHNVGCYDWQPLQTWRKSSWRRPMRLQEMGSQSWKNSLANWWLDELINSWIESIDLNRLWWIAVAGVPEVHHTQACQSLQSRPMANMQQSEHRTDISSAWSNRRVQDINVDRQIHWSSFVGTKQLQFIRAPNNPSAAIEEVCRTEFNPKL